MTAWNISSSNIIPVNLLKVGISYFCSKLSFLVIPFSMSLYMDFIFIPYTTVIIESSIKTTKTIVNLHLYTDLA